MQVNLHRYDTRIRDSSHISPMTRALPLRDTRFDWNLENILSCSDPVLMDQIVSQFFFFTAPLSKNVSLTTYSKNQQNVHTPSEVKIENKFRLFWLFNHKKMISQQEEPSKWMGPKSLTGLKLSFFYNQQKQTLVKFENYYGMATRPTAWWIFCGKLHTFPQYLKWKLLAVLMNFHTLEPV